MSANTGGPAFPQHVAPAYRQEPEIWGMTMRDYFAAEAMAELIGLCLPSDSAEVTASKAYKYADAMLAERCK